MADKNLARSGPADLGHLSDDDPLAELARIVGYEPRNVPTAARPVPPKPIQEPTFDLESELLQEFARYDAPETASVDAEVVSGDVPAIDEVDRQVATEQSSIYVDSFVPAVESEDDSFGGQSSAYESGSDWREAASNLDEGFNSDAASSWFSARVEQELDQLLPSFHSPAIVQAEAAGETQRTSSEQHSEDVPPFLGLPPIEAADVSADPVGLDLDRELELSLGEAIEFSPSSQTASPVEHEADARSYAVEPLQPAIYDAAASGLAIVESNVQSGVLQESFVEALPVAEPTSHDVGGSSVTPVFEQALPVTPEFGQGGHFETAELPVEIEAVDFIPDWISEPHSETALSSAEEALSPAVAEELEAAAFDAEGTYEQAPVSRAENGYALDDLLAEVERYPVPEARSPLVAEPQVSRPRPGSLEGFSSVKFGRATPVAFKPQPIPAALPPVPEASLPEAPILPPVAAAAIEVEVPAVPTSAAFAPAPEEVPSDAPLGDLEDPFANFELDLSDIELDLDPAELSVPEEPSRVVVAPAPAPIPTTVVDEFKPVPVASSEPAFVSPVFAEPEREPQQVQDFDVVLPFDPSLIAETDTSVAPVAELDVPQLPVIDKEKPAAPHPEYDLDIDAEMAQLFADPAPSGGYARSATVATVATASVTKAREPDEFEKALEEDLRRSLSQPERQAIPLDAQQADEDYVGDGYDEPRRGKGLMIAAAAAMVVLGGAGVYAFIGGGGAVGDSSEPRIIMADKDPVKIVPEEKGGTTVPNQDKAVYDRVAGSSDANPQQEQLVTSTEEPVDVVQRTLTPESLPMDGPEDDLASATPDDASGNERLLPGVDDAAEATTGQNDKSPVVSARKVRTMIVKPDGTLVAREEPAAEAQSALAAPSEGAADAAVPTGGDAVANAGGAANAAADIGLREQNSEVDAARPDSLKEVADSAVAESTPIRTVKTTTIGNTAGTATDTSVAQPPVGEAAASAPVPAARPAAHPVDAVEAPAERGQVAEAQPTETAALAAEPAQSAPSAAAAPVANPGGYVIQIASLPSEEEAQKSYKSLSAKFSSVIGGRGVDIKRAEIPSKGTYFRVRIPAGSREEANALCGQYKSAGGSCLVTR